MSALGGQVMSANGAYEPSTAGRSRTLHWWLGDPSSDTWTCQICALVTTDSPPPRDGCSSTPDDDGAVSVVNQPCRYCGTTYTTCVDGEPCCKACLYADGHESRRASSCGVRPDHLWQISGGEGWRCLYCSQITDDVALVRAGRRSSDDANNGGAR